MKKITCREIAEVPQFVENAVYTTEEAALILRRSTKAVRTLCNRGLLKARRDRGGFLITGWAIRGYLERDCTIDNENKEKRFNGCD